MSFKFNVDQFINLFGNKAYFDKRATIEKYFSVVNPEDRPKAETYDEIYKIALKYVCKQDFDNYTKGCSDYFYLLSKEDIIVAISLGIVSFGIACLVDSKGNEIEKFIDDLLPGKYDVNNAFDLMKGKGHRMFGHDIPTFGIKNIPADFLVQVKDGIGGYQKAPLGMFLGIDGVDSFSMWDIIKVFYGGKETKLKNIMSYLGHTIAHFGKDIFTPDGLPLPFTSLFNQYIASEDGLGKILKYKNSFFQKHDTVRLFIKASDFITVSLIDGFIDFYCRKKLKDQYMLSGYMHDFKLISMGTCISLQLATILIGEGIQAKKKESRKLVPGGKINILMNCIFFKIAIQEMISVVSARNDINKYYDEVLKDGVI